MGQTNLTEQLTAHSNGRRWALLLPAMLLPAVGSVFYFHLWHGTTAANLLYSGVKLFTVVYPVICAVWLLRIPLPFKGQSLRFHIRAVPAGIVLGLAIVGVAIVLLQTPLGPVVIESAGTMREHLAGTMWLNYFIPLALALSLVHSLIEEVYWRWFVYGQLCLLIPKGWALILGGLAFSLHHVIVLLQFFEPAVALPFSACVGIGGVFWSLMMDRQKTLAGAWISHLVVDLGMFGIGYWLLFC